MTILFGRQARVVAGSLDITELRIKFDVEKTLVGYPNKANIKIYNLKETSRNQIEKDGLFIKLYAGYSDLILLFSGDIINVVHQKIGVDWVSELFCGDSINSISTATINKTLAAGATTEQIFDELISNMQGVTKGVTEGISNCLNGKQSLLRGLQLTGNIKDWLRRIAEQ